MSDSSSSSDRSMKRIVLSLLQEHPVWVGLAVRCLIAWLLPLWLDDGDVPYTDIDYHVFSDAAAYIQQGESPYKRHTYRYTPFLAAFLAVLPHRQAGRFCFCLADTVCGWMILKFRQANRAKKETTTNNANASTSLLGLCSSSPEFQDALWWLYNPLAINICTRGSAESLVVLLPVLMTVWIIQTKHDTFGAMAAGFWHGVAVHAKLYPVIYTLSYAAHLATATSDVQEPKYQRVGQNAHSNDSSKQCQQTAMAVFRRVPCYLWLWIRRLLTTPACLMFGLSFVVTFVVLTYLAVAFYGPLAFQEGLLYHFARVDHRHNYSMHWYWIYLARAREEKVLLVDDSLQQSVYSSANMAVAGKLLLLPQLALLLYTSLSVSPSNLTLALFIQTFCFVAQNKVITAQYFTWYLCLLPLCSHLFVWTKSCCRALVVLLLAIVFWLASAYCLEMQGMAVHRLVWVASVIFFVANVNLLGALLASISTTVINHGQDTTEPTLQKKQD